MNLPSNLEPLFNQAYGFVRRFINERGVFTPFALTVKPSGEITPVQVSESAKDINSAITAILQCLLPWARSGEICATVICMPIPREATRYKVDAVVFDLESDQKERVLAVMQYHKTEKYGWNFGPIEYKRDTPKVFAVQPPSAPNSRTA